MGAVLGYARSLSRLNAPAFGMTLLRGSASGNNYTEHMFKDIISVPVGIVHCSVREAVDDVWGGVVSRIDLDSSRFTPDALLGLSDYSHVEIIFHFDRLPESYVITGARHPRGRSDWPSVGIFAQRAKRRPNRLGATVCQLNSVRGLSIEVEGLDAIDGTPVLDIKPYIAEFGPRGPVQQPAWATELMAGYYRKILESPGTHGATYFRNQASPDR
jgi:tRNA (Thr-GGU) A37 N-methylase